VLSQTQNHTEAADNAKKSVKLVHQLFKDLLSLCAMYIRKIEHKDLQLLNKQQRKAENE
jgi:AraC-like DNA-binding protein